MIQVPDQIDIANNITRVGFGLKHFSILGIETVADDIEFSDEQKDAFGGEWKAAHVTYHTFASFMMIAIVVPVLLAIKQVWRSKMDKSLAMANMTKTYAKISIPVLLFSTIFMICPWVLMFRSNICGPSYIQLGYQEQPADFEAQEATIDNDWWDGLEGTFATVHPDIKSSCELGTSSVLMASFLGVWLLVLIVQAMVLYNRGNQLNAAFENDVNNDQQQDSTAIEVYEKSDDATVESGMEDHHGQHYNVQIA